MQRDAQKSEVHQATEDASTSPANRSPDAGKPHVEPRPRNGSNGNGEHVPAADDESRQRQTHLPGVHVRRDESDLGGPIDLDVYDK